MQRTNSNINLLNIDSDFPFVIIKQNKNLKSIKGHNSVTKTTGNNPKLNLVKMNAYTKFGHILSISSQDIKR